MPGVPGSGGPPPKRSSQRRRQNKPTTPIETAPGATDVVPPPAEEDWHPLARRWYDSLADSGQSVWYEPSDWALAGIIAESMSRDLAPRIVTDDEGNVVLDEDGKPMTRRLPMRGASLAAYLKAMTALLTTEGDRRRLKIELDKAQAGQPEAPSIPNLDDYRGRFAG